MFVATKNSATKLTITWPLLPEDFQLPDDPVEDESQPLLAAALRQPLTEFPELIQDALIVSNFALCAGISLPEAATDEQRTICKAPDWMYVKPVNPQNVSQIRRSYTPHTEGTIPQIVMEFLSETYGEEYSVEFTSRVGKWFFYEHVIKVPTYVIFRAKTARLEVYALESERYNLQQTDENGRYWIPGLDLFLGVWEGTHEGRTGCWLRWWNAAGELLLWSEERTEQERQRADRESLRAERLAEKLRQAGITLDDED
ncbi:MAG: Uma2 family endonuclease [Microcoleus sp. PH2017_40_RAT_O_B]|uniref:Uma2 family endonuclease n=1 Tax=unclassified Microcoleus TaxID=2642155 RepID=UPI001DF58B67|nr:MULTISPECIES: Uma2 family endonuclease [unclassified Microcoleus]MCC3575992.1 Uma2 family endonuclease [Microcoleus sp. PH2017_34_RAT_O_A]MCC3613793.1 Uma2 family endonuclease [Microcoleus sp. PH2017_40_RAT_O_B]